MGQIYFIQYNDIPNSLVTHRAETSAFSLTWHQIYKHRKTVLHHSTKWGNTLKISIWALGLCTWDQLWSVKLVRSTRRPQPTSSFQRFKYMYTLSHILKTLETKFHLKIKYALPLWLIFKEMKYKIRTTPCLHRNCPFYIYSTGHYESVILILHIFHTLYTKISISFMYIRWKWHHIRIIYVSKIKCISITKIIVQCLTFVPEKKRCVKRKVIPLTPLLLSTFLTPSAMFIVLLKQW